jgi:NifU-like protein
MAEAESLTTLLAERTTKPQHLGRQDDATVTSTVGSIIVGRALRLFLTISDQKVTAATFQVFACREQVGLTDVVLDRLIDASVDDLAHLDEATVVGWLAELGAATVNDIGPLLPVQLWVVTAVQEAIRQLPDRQLPDGASEAHVDPVAELPRVCRCHGVSKAELERLRDEQNLKTVQALSVASGAGTGCGTCLPDVEDIVRGSQAAEPEAAAGGVLGRMAVLKQAAAALRATIVEAAEAGVAIEPWDLGENEVLLKITAGPEVPIQPHVNAATAALQAELGEKWQATAMGS